jgi:hypothetical protein
MVNFHHIHEVTVGPSAHAAHKLKTLFRAFCADSAAPDPTQDRPPQLMIPKILLLVEQIRPTTAQIDNLGAPIAVLLEACTFEAVECIGDALTTAYDALVLVVAEGAFVADAGEGGGAHVGVADGAFAVTFVAQTADRNARLLAAHYKIAGRC